MAGPDARADDYTDDLPPLIEAFTIDPRLRASTSYIVARAATLLSMFRRGDKGTWLGDESGDASVIAPVQTPAWTDPELTDAVPRLAEAPRLQENLLQQWARRLPDDISPNETPPPGSPAVTQSDAVRELADDGGHQPQAALRLVASSLADGHPLVRVAAAAAITQHDLAVGGARRRPNPWARAILDDAASTRSDEVAELAAAVPDGRITPERRLAVETGTPSAAQHTVRPDAALVHGTWARKEHWWQRSEHWWRPSGDFHDFLRAEQIFPQLYSGEEPYEWSGYYSMRTRLPRQRVDWSRMTAGGDLAWWSHENLALPPHLIGHSCGASVAMLATRKKHMVRALVLLSPSVHQSCLPDPDYYRRGLVVRAKHDLVLAADASNYGLLDHLPRLDVRYVRRKGLTGHQATHDRDCWLMSGLDAYVRDEWLPTVPT
jgi:hypothetical protein